MEMNKDKTQASVKLAYIVESQDGLYESGLESFNTKKAAQIYDRFLKEHYGDTIVHSNIIYDEAE